MKKLYLILTVAAAALEAHSQAVLNEIYAFPSSGNHEFFELYNTSPGSTPVSVDGYTLVSYFEDNGQKGFYVMDLPNLTMPYKGYFVGASKIPFNYQGFTNSSKADFNWNDAAFRNGSTGGYLKKWYLSNANQSDGNPGYDEEVLPLDFNDFFSRKSGGGASFNAFLYKNGVLINTFIGGTGGSTFIPTFITAMPSLNFTNISNNTSVNYVANFSLYKAGAAEYVIQDIGIDNGFIRKSDGFCGTWDKSSAQAFHTPQQPNGGSQLMTSASLTIDAHISRGTNGNPSFIVYNVTAGTSSLFPVELFVYVDNGSIVGQWDANDLLLASKVENVVTDGPFTTSFTPVNQQIIIVAKTALGCFDQVRVIANPDPGTVLPISLKSFRCRKKEANYLLEWVTSNNELASSFEVEQSLNGQLFKKLGVIPATLKPGDENYSFLVPLSEEATYRLKVTTKDKRTFYSAILRLEHSNMTDKIKVLQNPVTSSLLRFEVQATAAGNYTVSIYNSSGTKRLQKLYTLQAGDNTITIEFDRNVPAGMYLLEVTNGREKYLKQFISQ